MSILHTYKMLNEDEDIRPITWEMREEYVDRMLQREYPGNLIGKGLDEFTEYYRYAYDEYHVWGHELTEGVFTIALLAEVKDKGGPWWRPDLFERNLSDDDVRDDVVLSPAYTNAIERSIEEFEAALACPVARPQLLARLNAAIDWSLVGRSGDIAHSSNC